MKIDNLKENYLGKIFVSLALFIFVYQINTFNNEVNNKFLFIFIEA